MRAERPRPRILDLYCGAGGIARGFALAGFEVVGVDCKRQPRYPYEFVQADALAFLDSLTWLELTQFHAIHASPPCPAYSVLRRANPGAVYPEMIEPTRDRLREIGLPWVIENVPGAPLDYSVILCGSMFGLGAMSGDDDNTTRQYRQLRRHRLFETSFAMLQPSCMHEGESLGVYGGGPLGRYTYETAHSRTPDTRRGGYQGTAAEKAEAMQLRGLTREEINNAIPPAYGEFLGAQLLHVVKLDRPFLRTA